MKKIDLFTQYEPETLFLKAKKDICVRVEQWPQSYLDVSQIDSHILALKKDVLLTVPDVDFLDGQEIVTEKIFSLSEIQPGAKPDAKVRLNVLLFKYKVKGQMFLLGCRPAVNIPEPVGEWIADSINNDLYIQYKWYERSPKRVINAHRNYIAKLLPCYENLKIAFEKLAFDIDKFVDESVIAKKGKADHRSQLLSLLQP